MAGSGFYTFGIALFAAIGTFLFVSLRIASTFICHDN